MKLLGFEHPDDLLYWLPRDLWLRREADGRVRVGVTEFGVRVSGHFFMCRPKPVGTAVEQGATLAVVELNKAVVTLKSPVTGVVREVNAALEDWPDLIERDPYGDGWIAALEPTRWAADCEAFVHGDALPEAAMRRMRLENLDELRAGDGGGPDTGTVAGRAGTEEGGAGTEKGSAGTEKGSAGTEEGGA